ncbi:MAG: hypothetical protein IH946_07090 [Bacteroidetes bacterium]|nr:hypothetical protein [Bacteroidota bacterium]
MIKGFIGNVVNVEEHPVSESEIGYSFKGDNKKRTLVLIDVEGDVMSEDNAIFLSKILGAIDHSIDDICLLNLAINPNHQFRYLSLKLEFDHLISFGPTVEDISLSIIANKYSCIQFDEKKLLFCNALDILAKDDVQKKELWSALMEMFNIKKT